MSEIVFPEGFIGIVVDPWSDSYSRVGEIVMHDFDTGSVAVKFECGAQDHYYDGLPRLGARLVELLITHETNTPMVLGVKTELATIRDELTSLSAAFQAARKGQDQGLAEDARMAFGNRIRGIQPAT